MCKEINEEKHKGKKGNTDFKSFLNITLVHIEYNLAPTVNLMRLPPYPI